MEDLLQDIRYALRSLARSPGFTAVALLTLALGIGANAAMFSAVDGVLLRPLPYAQADRIVQLHQANLEQEIRTAPFSLPDFEDWREQVHSFGPMAAFIAVPSIVTGRGEPTEVQSALVAGDFFGVLGASPQVGRPLLEEDAREAIPNAVISDRLWRTHFDADPDVLGQPILLSGRSYTVVGVMPSGFRYPTPETDTWTPQSVLSDDELGVRSRRDQRFLEGVARLAEGATQEQAKEELDAVAARLAAEYPATNAGWNAVTVVPLRRAIVGDIDRALVVVLAVVGFILLIGCANLANLLLARGAARSREIAIRTALGAGRGRLVRQLLTESLVLALLGGVLGLLLSVWGVQTLLALSADILPRVEDIRVDGRVIGFGLLLALVTGVTFGLLPALRVAEGEPRKNLKGGRGAIGRGDRVRSALVVAEVGLAVLLVIGAGLMMRSFLELRSVDAGFDPERVLAVSMQLNTVGVSGNVAVHIVNRREELIERVSALPGVLRAGTVNSLPLQDQRWESVEFTRADGTGAPDGGSLRAVSSYVSPGYLQTLGVPLIRGEPLPDATWAAGAPVPFLVNETAARRFWPGEDAVGQMVRAWWGEGVVIGVTGDVRHLQLADEAEPSVYFPQIFAPRLMTTLVVRTAEDPFALAQSIRQIVQELDPNQPIRSIATLGSVMSESIASDRFFTILFGIFGGLALVLAAIGVYGVLAYSVGQRTQEIGVRMALGARAQDVLRMVVGGGMLLVLTGAAFGTAVAILLRRVLESQLYGISAGDPVAFGLAPLALVLVALLACYLPARRATRIDPLAALRDE